VSFAELLDAARALPRDEQLRLANALLEHEPAPAAEVPEHLRPFPEHLWPLIPPPGAVVEVWSPVATTDAAGWEAIQQMLREIEAGRQQG
jgi:hypothetical protein